MKNLNPKAFTVAQTFNAKPMFTFANKSDKSEGEIFIYDAIGEDFWGDTVTPKSVVTALAELKGVKTLYIRLNSPGGSMFDGAAIYAAIRRFDAHKIVTVDGLAASAASMIAMAGDEVWMSPTATMMIHNAQGFTVGDAKVHREQADLLEKLSNDVVAASYERTGQKPEQIRAWMDSEKWMNAEEAVDLGFADKIEKEEDEAPKDKAPPAPRADATEACNCSDSAIKPCGCCKNCHDSAVDCPCDSRNDRACKCCENCHNHSTAEAKTERRITVAMVNIAAMQIKSRAASRAATAGQPASTQKK